MPDMTNTEAVEMIRRCKQEILNLRATIARLEPKAEAYDNMVRILCLLPQPSRAMGEDIVWMLDKRIRELSAPAETPDAG